MGWDHAYAFLPLLFLAFKMHMAGWKIGFGDLFAIAW